MKRFSPDGARLKCSHLALLVLMTLGACESDTAPTASPTGPQYRLIRIDSAVLPLVAYVTPPDTTFLTTEVVTLRDDGMAAFVREYRTVSAGSAARTGRMEFGLRWARSGTETITMSQGVVCVTAPCGVTLTGLVTDSTLQLVQSEPVTRVFYYERLTAASAAP